MHMHIIMHAFTISSIKIFKKKVGMEYQKNTNKGSKDGNKVKDHPLLTCILSLVFGGFNEIITFFVFNVLLDPSCNKYCDLIGQNWDSK